MRPWLYTSLLVLASPGCVDSSNELADLASTQEAVIYQASNIVVAADASIPATGGTASARHENCLVPRRDLNADAIADSVPVRTQMLIYRGATLRGVCTVVGDSANENIYMTQTGFNNRVALAGETTQTTTFPTVQSNSAGAAGASYNIPTGSTTVVADLTSGTANLVEELYKEQTTPRVLYGWPHLFESGTFAELTHFDSTSGARAWETTWAASFNNVEDVDEKFHVTAANIGPSFPMLNQHVAAGGDKLPYAVALHAHGAGATCTADMAVRVGGQSGDSTEKPMHRGIAEKIHLYTYDPVKDPTAFDTERITYKWGECFDGTGSSNFVNAATASGKGIQLEQYFAWINADSDSSVPGVQPRGQKVVNAVRSVFDCVSEAADASDLTPGATGNVDSGGLTGYASSGICSGFIGDISIGAAVQVVGVPTAGLSSCSGGGSAYVDYYRQQTNSGVQRWSRIGGGRILYDASCNLTYQVLGESGAWETSETTFRPTAADMTVAANTSVLFRAVVRASSSGGAAAPAVFSISN